MGKNLSNKYFQKPLDSAKKSTTGAIKAASKRAIQKAAEATGNLIGNKIADKIRIAGKQLPDDETEEDLERITPKKRYISPEIQQIIDELRSSPKTYVSIKVKIKKIRYKSLEERQLMN